MRVNARAFLKPQYINVGLVVLVLYLVSTSLKNLKTVANPSVNDKLPNSDRMPDTGSTITDEQAKSYANDLKNAFIYEGLKDSWELCKPVLNKLRNKADFSKVYNAFGLVQYSMTWGNVGDPIFSGKHDLLAIMSNELTIGQKAELAKNYSHLGIF